jgi:branched-chain amino acid transport system ATP-binding protein
MDILIVQDLRKNFGGLVAVQALNFTVQEAEIVGLIGPNGAGKTTVFNLITGAFRPDKGDIIFNNENISGLKPHDTCRKGIGRTFQITKPFNDLNVFENIMIACFPKSRTKKQALRKTEEIIDFVELYGKRERLAKHLTLADRKLLEIARALATEPKLLLLDEAIAGLNEKETNQAINLINKIRDRNISLVVIEHIFRVIMNIAQKVIVLDRGKKIAEGQPSSIIKDQRVIKAYFGEEYAFA